jgi:hypothetical protein
MTISVRPPFRAELGSHAADRTNAIKSSKHKGRRDDDAAAGFACLSIRR